MASSPGTLTTALTGTNNDLVFTARHVGRSSARLKVKYTDPGAASQALAVSVSYDEATNVTTINVSLATNGSSVITSTAAQISAAIAANKDANHIVSVANAAANDGTGVVTAMAATALSAGSPDGTTKGYATTDEMEDDSIALVNGSAAPYTAVVIVEGRAITLASNTLNGLYESAYYWKEQFLGKSGGSHLLLTGPAAD